MQYVSIRFQSSDRRSYTYHNDGEPVSKGDTVKVLTNDGVKSVKVVGLPTAVRPSFKTKPIIHLPNQPER